MCKGETEFHFGDEWAFQQLFAAVTELCGLGPMIAATGYELCDLEDDADQEEEV